ncbi:MAG: hypothetical protein E6J41_04230 [Chloroflexi bacterium]|nr:MAG: hypothetical protein E6J41_04230 [Chloroflexota bacterium]
MGAPSAHRSASRGTSAISGFRTHTLGRSPCLRRPGILATRGVGQVTTAAPASGTRGVSSWAVRSLATLARALLYGDRAGVGALCFLLLVVAAALAAPLIAPYDPVHVTTDNLAAPSARHLMGTDQFGRDVLSRILWGARLTLAAPVVGIGISTAVGVPLGLVAGYSTRWVSGLIMRAMDVLLAFPGLLLALIVVTIIGSGLLNVMSAARGAGSSAGTSCPTSRRRWSWSRAAPSAGRS